MGTTTIILGGGIIGFSTAYYIALNDPTSKIHIIESSPTLFTSASGKAAGFLARDWFIPSLTELGELSFTLHSQLAREHGGAARWEYSGSTGVSVFEDGSGDARGLDWLLEGTSRASVASGVAICAEGEKTLPRWFESAGGSGKSEVISGVDTTAQVEPMKLCRFLLESCLERGVKVHYPVRAKGVRVVDGEVVGVQVESEGGELEVIEGGKLLIACGVWTGVVFDELFPEATVKLPVRSLAGYSLVLRSPRWKPEEEDSGRGCHAVFTVDPDGWSPEIFSRKGGDIYIAGLNSSTIPVPKSAAEVVFEEEAIKPMLKAAKNLLGEDIEVVRSALCFRPITTYGRPIIGKFPPSGIGLKGNTEGGVYVATGHGPWGISLSLGTGKVMAEMMNGDKTSANVESLGV